MKQRWIYKSWYDLIFILAPPFLCFVVIFLFPSEFFPTSEPDEFSDVWWIILILLVDVAHVYSTLYRTYFDKETFKYYRTLYTLIPILVFAFNVITFSISAKLFWSLLAYLAVFHFIRQQYGFFKIYSRGMQQKRWIHWIDNISIYTLTVYPILYWHLSGPKSFNWFTTDDFLFMECKPLLQVATILYFLILVVYIIKEMFVSIQQKFFNVPKNLLWIGTAASWYFGIVYFNGDLTFTILNVVAHGIPYMALIWIYGVRKNQKGENRFLKTIFSTKGIFIFFALIAFFGYVEEGFWNAWVWKDKDHIFPVFNLFGDVSSKELLILVVGLLATPQLTHYILDGFIWKMKKDKEGWQESTLNR